MYKILIFLLVAFAISCNNRPAAHDGGQLDTNEVPPNAEATVTSLLLSRLEGKWQSTEDSKNVIEIKGSNFISYYDGSELSTEELQVYEQCQGECAEEQDLGDMACFITKGEAGVNCYALVSLDEQTLEYSLLGGTGNTLRYIRVTQ